MDDHELAKLEQDLMEKNRWLFLKLTEQKGLVERYGNAESEYRKALAKKMLELRAEGMSVTLIPDLARGDKAVSKLKLERDIAKGVSNACYQAIKAIQTAISAMQTLISKEKAVMNLR